MSTSFKNNRGFTLIEMIVALMIFSIVAVVALAALMRIISLNDKAQSTQSAITNLNFALESMSREMRVGSRFHCDPYWDGSEYDPSTVSSNLSCQVSSDINKPSKVALTFYSSKSGTGTAKPTCQLAESYFLEADPVSGAAPYTVLKSEQSTCDETLGNSNNTIPTLPLVSSNMIITGYNIKVLGGDDVQHPYQIVMLRLTGYAGSREKDRTSFDVQTAIAERHQ